MSNVLGVIYSPTTGVISFMTENSAESLAIDLPAMLEGGEASAISVPIEGATVDTHYVLDGVIKAYPAKPNEGVAWDLSTESWIIQLDEVKALKWEEMKTRRNDDEFGLMTYLSGVYEVDALSQRRIQGAVQLAALDPTMTMDWTLADNSAVTLTAAEIIGLGVALGQHVNAQHVKSRLVRASIDSATTLSELDAISW